MSGPEFANALRGRHLSAIWVAVAYDDPHGAFWPILSAVTAAVAVVWLVIVDTAVSLVRKAFRDFTAKGTP